MAKKAIKFSPALAHTLRERRKELGLSLREVVARTEELGERIPFSTLAKIEQGRLDPGIRRLHLLLKLYRLPIQMAGDILELEQQAAELPQTDDLQALYDQALEYWRRGDTRRGLAYLLALSRNIPEGPQGDDFRQKAHLAFAEASGCLGKHQLSWKIVENVLMEGVLPAYRVPAYLHAASAWNALGCPDVALAFLDRAAAHAQADDHKHRAWILHRTVGVLCSLGQLHEARQKLDETLEAYRQAKDAYGRSRAYALQVRLLEATGEIHEALRAARDGLKHAQQHGFDRLKILRRLQAGNLLVKLGDVEQGLAVLNEALAGAVSSKDRASRYYAHHYLSQAYQRLGDEDRAQMERNSADYFAQFVDSNAEDVFEVRGAVGGARDAEIGPKVGSKSTDLSYEP